MDREFVVVIKRFDQHVETGKFKRGIPEVFMKTQLAVINAMPCIPGLVQAVIMSF